MNHQIAPNGNSKRCSYTKVKRGAVLAQKMQMINFKWGEVQKVAVGTSLISRYTQKRIFHPNKLLQTISPQMTLSLTHHKSKNIWKNPQVIQRMRNFILIRQPRPRGRERALFSNIVHLDPSIPSKAVITKRISSRTEQFKKFKRKCLIWISKFN